MGGHLVRGSIGVLLVLLAAIVAGCGTSATSRFYELQSTATPGTASAATHAIMVGPVSVPGSVDRPEFVVQVEPNRVEFDEFNRWASPLGQSIARTVALDLAALLGTPNVASAPLANFDATYRVTIDVQRFETLPGKSVFLEAVWAVRATAGGPTHTGRSAARETVAVEGFDALAAAHSRALARMSGDIAAAIRAAAAAR